MVPNFTTEGEVKNRVFFQHVSPFLTGRRFVQYAFEPAGTWQDDEGDDQNLELEIQPDAALGGLFWVNDPSNDVTNEFPFVNTTKSGFNDLERRKEALCAISNRPCGSAQQQKSIIHIMGELQHVPLPLGAH